MKKLIKMTKHQFTKQEARILLTLWDRATKEEIAEKLNLRSEQIGYLAREMNKVGFELSKKRKVGQLRTMLKELKKELKTK